MEKIIDKREERIALVENEIECITNDFQKVELLSNYVGTSVRYLDKKSGTEIETKLISLDPELLTMTYTLNGVVKSMDLAKVGSKELRHFVLFFERLLEDNKYIVLDTPEYALLPNVIPFEGQLVRYETYSGTTLLGVCAKVSDKFIEIIGTEHTITVDSDGNQLDKSEKASTKIISINDFAEKGLVINEEQNILIEPAKPAILGKLQTIEEIAEFVLKNTELTAAQRSQINDYLIYRKTKPEAYQDIPEGQYSKVRFVDGLVESSLTEGTSLRNATQKAKEFVIEKVRGKSTITTQKGTVLNLNPEIEVPAANAKETVINLNDQEYSQVEMYTYMLLQGNELDSYTSAYNLSAKVLISIDSKIKSESNDTLKASLMKVKKVLGIIVQSYFDTIDAQISEDMVLEVENVMREVINRPSILDTERGEVKMVMVNGYTGSGKGTTLELLNAKASESGTDGIAGRGDGFEDYEQIMGPYDLARFAGEYIPNKLMRLLFATELINQRAKLDSQDRFDEPVYVSGFPRTDDQAKLFSGVEGIKAVSLNITPETAVFRVIRRMTEGLVLKGKAIRGDDLSDIAFATDDGKLLTPGVLEFMIRQLNAQEAITNVNQITPERIKAITDLITLSKGARYHRYNSDKPKIEKALATLGVNVYQIQGDELTPEQVSNTVRDYIDGVIEA